MKLGVQILGLLAVTTVVACGRVETKQKKDNTPADTTADDGDDSGTTKKPGKPTVPTKTTGPTGPTNTNTNTKCATATSAKDYAGNVAGFRKSNSASRTKVKLQNVVVTAISGDSDAITYYVADASGGEYSGVRVACGKKSECGTVPTALGQRVTVDGEATISDDCATIGVSAPKFSAGTGASMLPELLLVPADKLGSIAGTETIRGVKVAANDSEFTVSNARPQALLNANNKGATCETDGKGCCSGGPKYFGFEVTSKAGKKFYVTTDNYSSKANPGGFSKTSWPCDGKFENAVKTGDKFPGIAGIFDIRSGKAQLAPTTDSDLASHVGPQVPTGPTQPTGPTGTPTEECHDLPVTNPMCTECIECCTGSSCEQLCDCPADQNTNYCQSCEYKADCGDDAVFCLDDGQGNGFCGKYCDTDADCRQDSFCAEIGGIDANDQSVTVGWNCVPADNTCAQ